MNEDVLNTSIRRFLKTVGVTSQREIEKAAESPHGSAQEREERRGAQAREREGEDHDADYSGCRFSCPQSHG